MGLFNIALKVRAKNGILQDFIDKKGWSQSGLGKVLGVTPSRVGDWFNMKDYPRDPNIMLRLSEMVGKFPEEIFPELLRSKDWLTGEREWTVYKEVDTEMFLPVNEVKSLVANCDVDEPFLKDDVNKALATLSPKERRIIEMRLGLGDEPGEATLEEIGELFNVTKTRIMQLEAKALRKLRSPSRRDILKDYL
jgi:RNA polymerase sigma factor (sigma-70 family)